MSTYEIIFESLQNQINNGLITYELAEEVNDLAYEKYVMESTAAARHNLRGAAKAYEIGKNNAKFKALTRSAPYSKILDPKSKYASNDSITDELQKEGKEWKEYYKDMYNARPKAPTAKEMYKNAVLDNPSDDEETNKIEKRGYIKYGIKAKEGSREYKKLQKRAQKNSSMTPSDAKKERIKNDIKKDIKQSTKRGLDQTRNAFIPHKKVK